MPTLHFHIFRIPRRARLQLIRRLLISGIQRSADFPTQAPALPRLVLGVFAGHFVELGAVAEFGEGFFFLGVFFALEAFSLSAFFALLLCTLEEEKERGGCTKM